LSRHPVATELTAEMVRKFKEEWTAANLATAPAGSVGGTPSAATPQKAAPGVAAGPRPVLAVVTLASLVERETPRTEERPLVAGTFTNRLQRGMALQCDPTVVYAMEREHKYRGALTGKDLKFDSPYNTYEHAGLPPGPIANPGEAALRAALQPAKTDYLYFVANTRGGHFFCRNLSRTQPERVEISSPARRWPGERTTSGPSGQRRSRTPQGRKSMSEPLNANEHTHKEHSKKELILAAAREIKTASWTPAEIDQLRRRLMALHGEAGKTSSEYIADVLQAAGLQAAAEHARRSRGSVRRRVRGSSAL
jgi:hypothetical protein